MDTLSHKTLPQFKLTKTQMLFLNKFVKKHELPIKELKYRIHMIIVDVNLTTAPPLVLSAVGVEAEDRNYP